MKKLIILLLVFLLIGCTKDVGINSEVEQTNKIELNEHSTKSLIINNQEFEIIPYFNEYAQYVNTEYKSRQERIESYRSLILSPLARLLITSTSELENDVHLTRPDNLKKLEKVLVGINEQYLNVISQIQEALIDATSRLEMTDKVKIYIMPYPDTPYNTDYMRGVAGFSMGASRNIALFIDPFNYTDESLKALTVHEYHHTALLTNQPINLRDQILLDQVIIEGKAELFTKIIYPSYVPLYLDRLSPEIEPAIWNYVKEKSEKPLNINDLYPLFYGDVYHRFPSHSNYKMGFKIMEALLEKNPEMDVDSWTYMNAIDIVKDVDVDSWYE